MVSKSFTVNGAPVGKLALVSFTCSEKSERWLTRLAARRCWVYLLLWEVGLCHDRCSEVCSNIGTLAGFIFGQSPFSFLPCSKCTPSSSRLLTHETGYDTGQISDFLLMDDFLLRFAQCTTPGDVATCEFSNVREGLIVAMLSVGTLFGALLGAQFADWLGRRRAMTADCAIVIVGTVIQVASVSSWVQLMVGRIVTGVGVGALSAAVPVGLFTSVRDWMRIADPDASALSSRNCTQGDSRLSHCNISIVCLSLGPAW